MTTYVLIIDGHMPELTCDVRVAKARQQNLADQGFSVQVAKYELKTQGKNFGVVSQFQSYIV